jgi:hypothetical protein
MAYIGANEVKAIRDELTREQKINEIITCVAFVAFVVLLCFMPDLTRG